uniref:G-protein coupled receptors family 1 profile domain-containing protein n=1 Tax=Oreochromis aureus TaxID=47969 RepID=A0AAZ1XT04_OREAU
MSLQNASINVTHFIIGGFDTLSRPIAVGVAILITYLLAVLANIANIMFIISDKRLHKPMYLLICNLAVVDIVYTSSCSPTMIGVLLAGVNTISYVECLIQMCVGALGTAMESFVLAFMALDRFIAIIYPFQYHSYLTNTRAVQAKIHSFTLTHIHSSLTHIYFHSHIHIFSVFHSHTHTFFFHTHIFSLSHTYIFTLTYIYFHSHIHTFFFHIHIFSLSHTYIFTLTYIYFHSHIHIFSLYFYIHSSFTHIYFHSHIHTFSFMHSYILLSFTFLGPCLVNPFVYSLRTKEIKQKFYKIFKKFHTSD